MPMLRWNDETEISTNAPNRQSDARIAALAGGGFVAVWEDRLTPASSPVMFVRVYLSNGEPAAAAAIIVGGNILAGYMVAQESGSDTAAASGAVVVSGAMAAIEAGADGFDFGIDVLEFRRPCHRSDAAA